MTLAPILSPSAASALAFETGVLVSGAGTTATNGLYTEDGVADGRTKYSFGEYVIAYETSGDRYVLKSAADVILYAETDAPSTPWDGVWSDVEGLTPAPTVTAARV
jgi:hypothetical protein